MLLDAPKATLAKVDNLLLGREPNFTGKESRSLKTFSYTEAAKQLNMSRKTLYKLIKLGQLNAIPCSGRKRISKVALDAYVETYVCAGESR